MTELQRHIEETISQIVHLEKVASQLQHTKDEFRESQVEIARLEEILHKELEDIEKLEGLSTRAIFHKVLGDQKEQLEIERQEYLEMSLKYGDFLNRLRILEYEINLLESKIVGKEKLENQLALLKKRRAKEILESDPVLRVELLRVSQELEHNYRLKKELKEAIEVGTLCLNLTNQVVLHLQKVDRWGSGGLPRRRRVYRKIRRESIDKARSITYQVKHHLNLFDKELNDLGKKLTIDLNVEALSNFTEFFFDNLITDWILQQKATKAISAVRYTIRQLSNILEQLESEFSLASGMVDKLKKQREVILTS